MPASDTSATRLPRPAPARCAARRRPGWRRCRPRWAQRLPWWLASLANTRAYPRRRSGRRRAARRARASVMSPHVADRRGDNMQSRRQRRFTRTACPPLACDRSLPSISIRPPEFRADALVSLALATVAFLLGACTERPSPSTPARRPRPPRLRAARPPPLRARRASRCCCRSAAAAPRSARPCSRPPRWRCSTPGAKELALAAYDSGESGRDSRSSLSQARSRRRGPGAGPAVRHLRPRRSAPLVRQGGANVVVLLQRRAQRSAASG